MVALRSAAVNAPGLVPIVWVYGDYGHDLSEQRSTEGDDFAAARKTKKKRRSTTDSQPRWASSSAFRNLKGLVEEMGGIIVTFPREDAYVFQFVSTDGPSMTVGGILGKDATRLNLWTAPLGRMGLLHWIRDKLPKWDNDTDDDDNNYLRGGLKWKDRLDPLLGDIDPEKVFYTDSDVLFMPAFDHCVHLPTPKLLSLGMQFKPDEVTGTNAGTVLLNRRTFTPTLMDEILDFASTLPLDKMFANLDQSTYLDFFSRFPDRGEIEALPHAINYRCQRGGLSTDVAMFHWWGPKPHKNGGLLCASQHPDLQENRLLAAARHTCPNLKTWMYKTFPWHWKLAWKSDRNSMCAESIRLFESYAQLPFPSAGGKSHAAHPQFRPQVSFRMPIDLVPSIQYRVAISYSLDNLLEVLLLLRSNRRYASLVMVPLVTVPFSAPQSSSSEGDHSDGRGPQQQELNSAQSFSSSAFQRGRYAKNQHQKESHFSAQQSSSTTLIEDMPSLLSKRTTTPYWRIGSSSGKKKKTKIGLLLQQLCGEGMHDPGGTNRESNSRVVRNKFSSVRREGAEKRFSSQKEEEETDSTKEKDICTWTPRRLFASIISLVKELQGRLIFQPLSSHFALDTLTSKGGRRTSRPSAPQKEQQRRLGLNQLRRLRAQGGSEAVNQLSLWNSFDMMTEEEIGTGESIPLNNHFLKQRDGNNNGSKTKLSSQISFITSLLAEQQEETVDHHTVVDHHHTRVVAQYYWGPPRSGTRPTTTNKEVENAEEALPNLERMSEGSRTMLLPSGTLFTSQFDVNHLPKSIQRLYLDSHHEHSLPKVTVVHHHSELNSFTFNKDSSLSQVTIILENLSPAVWRDALERCVEMGTLVDGKRNHSEVSISHLCMVRDLEAAVAQQQEKGEDAHSSSSRIRIRHFSDTQRMVTHVNHCLQKEEIEDIKGLSQRRGKSEPLLSPLTTKVHYQHESTHYRGGGGEDNNDSFSQSASDRLLVLDLILNSTEDFSSERKTTIGENPPPALFTGGGGGKRRAGEQLEELVAEHKFHDMMNMR